MPAGRPRQSPDRVMHEIDPSEMTPSPSSPPASIYIAGLFAMAIVILRFKPLGVSVSWKKGL